VSGPYDALVASDNEIMAPVVGRHVVSACINDDGWPALTFDDGSELVFVSQEEVAPILKALRSPATEHQNTPAKPSTQPHRSRLLKRQLHRKPREASTKQHGTNIHDSTIANLARQVPGPLPRDPRPDRTKGPRTLAAKHEDNALKALDKANQALEALDIRSSTKRPRQDHPAASGI
jgi:hypothetical protein